VIEQRKQGALKGSQLKVEAHGPNGEEGIYTINVIWNLWFIFYVAVTVYACLN